MSLTSIMNNATSGLTAAQIQLRVVSDNVANVNTEGYVRKVAEQVSVSSQGVGAGVAVSRVRLATDRFLQAASLNANAESQRQGARYDLYDRVQSLFGDPSADSGFFAQIDSLFAAFAPASENAGSTPYRQDALYKLQSTFEEAGRIAGQIQAVREDADGRIGSAVNRANDLLSQIENLNIEISRSTVNGGDASGAESAQAKLIDELSGIMDVRLSQRPVGGVTLRTADGKLLAGDGAATLSYQRAGAVNAETSFDQIWVTEPRGTKRSLQDSLGSGELKGLLEIRDQDAPAATERLAELTSHIADEINRAHNASTSVPAPTALTGRNVGQSLDTALTGFTGKTTVAVVNAAGVIQSRADVVFSGSTLTVNGVSTTPGNFLTTLNAQLPGATASFAGGKLSIAASAAGNGIAIADDATTPSTKAGRGFSHYFGLNDLVTTDRVSNYDTGLTTASIHGFAAGGKIDFRLAGPGGTQVRDIAFTVPAGATTVGQLVSALNDPTSGLGRYGTFALDATGQLKFSANAGTGITLSTLNDTTVQTPSGVSMTDLFGLGSGVRSSRADGFAVRPDILGSPSRLALAHFDPTVAAGTPALASGDGRGALDLADAASRNTTFGAAGSSTGGSQSISRYAAEMAGDIGARAAAAGDRKEAAETLYSEAQARRQGEEGVNLDEELVKLTTYQQAFAASARLIQSCKDMYDVLLGMM